jgi:hypothetical protein
MYKVVAMRRNLRRMVGRGGFFLLKSCRVVHSPFDGFRRVNIHSDGLTSSAAAKEG